MKRKSNVIGPFDISDWQIMLMTKRSIDWMKKTDRVFYDDAIRKETLYLKGDFFSRIAA